MLGLVKDAMVDLTGDIPSCKDLGGEWMKTGETYTTSRVAPRREPHVHDVEECRDVQTNEVIDPPLPR